eukprot:297548-Rhodomonas_salina.3
MSGTGIAQVPCGVLISAVLRYGVVLSGCAISGLTYGMAISTYACALVLNIACLVPRIWYCLRSCYAMSGTDTGTSSLPSCPLTYLDLSVDPAWVSSSPRVLRLYYAMSGTDTVYAATRSTKTLLLSLYYASYLSLYANDMRCPDIAHAAPIHLLCDARYRSDVCGPMACAVPRQSICYAICGFSLYDARHSDRISATRCGTKVGYSATRCALRTRGIVLRDVQYSARFFYSALY